MPPERYAKALDYLKSTGMFGVISGIIAGKPMNGRSTMNTNACLPKRLRNMSCPCCAT